MIDPVWLSVPLASLPMMHWPLLLTEYAMALQLLRLFMSCFLSLECPYPRCPQRKRLLILHGPNISSSDGFPILLHNELLPPALCTWPVWFLPPWVAQKVERKDLGEIQKLIDTTPEELLVRGRHTWCNFIEIHYRSWYSCLLISRIMFVYHHRFTDYFSFRARIIEVFIL